ncbi:MAG: TIGR01777 family oxidoreductase [Gemmatimonadota bacterium]|nr:TIGR01777 family oxidoreductase [Gemmatimonadota bacterium]
MASDTARQPSPNTIAITGATGLIGSELVEHLRARGHTVRRIVRSAPGPGDVLWDPAHDLIDARALVGVDAVVNLAGEPIAHRWTAERKGALRESRVRGTALLARAVTSLPVKPRVFLNGSAVGYYGDRGDDVLDEQAGPGEGFLPRLAADWEAATAPIADAGVRVALLRTGIVLSPTGGALEKLLPVYKLGGGGPLGSGKQWMSWITLGDHVRAIEHVLFSEGMRGAVNLTTPTPVRNVEFAATLGRVLGRPAVLPVPTFALELLYGEMARATLLAGQRVMPAALTSAGFHFDEPTLEGALRRILNRPV